MFSNLFWTPMSCLVVDLNAICNWCLSFNTAGSIEMQRAWNEEISDAQQLSDAAHDQRLESTSTIGTTDNTAISAGAVVGIVIGTVVVVIALIVTIILVRYYLCFCFDRRKPLSNDFTVSCKLNFLFIYIYLKIKISGILKHFVNTILRHLFGFVYLQ